MILSSHFSPPLLKFCMKALLVCIRLFLCSSDKSLGTHLAQTRLIQKSSVRILKTEDLLTSLIDATSLNVRRLSCHESGISLYRHKAKAFHFFQRLLYRKLNPKIVCATCRLVILICVDAFLCSPSFVSFR